jgi:hypothetical protein
MKFLLKTIYKNIFFKKYIFMFIKIFYKPSRNIYQHLWFSGFFKTKFLDKKFYIYSLPTIIENEIFWNGIANTWEPLSLKIWSRIVKKKKLFLILGPTQEYILFYQKCLIQKQKYMHLNQI